MHDGNHGPEEGSGHREGGREAVGDQRQEARTRDYVLTCDEPSSLGGCGAGPNPVEFFMAAVGFSEDVTLARFAALRGLAFDALETSVRGPWDRRGQGEGEGIEPAFTDFVVETIREVTRMGHRKCPMHASIQKIGPVVDKLFVNGIEVTPSSVDRKGSGIPSDQRRRR